jgi:hypothetical protein
MGLRAVLTAAITIALAAVCATPARAVIGGKLAALEERPYQVALVLRGQSAVTGQFCGGSIRDETHVVTAAHCVFDNQFTQPGQPIAPATIDVLAGTTTLSNEGLGQRVGVARVSLEPRYDPSTFRNDVAVLTLDSQVVPGPRVQSIERIDDSAWPDVQPPTALTVSGWGLTEAGTYADTLRVAQVPMLSDDDCRGDYPGFDGSLMLCAGSATYDACFGDSGGPLTLPASATSPTDRLVGVVSFGGARCADPDHPGVYTELAAPGIRSYFDVAQPADAPRSIAAPSIREAPQVGRAVTCDRGAWEGTPSAFAYQFARNTATGAVALTDLAPADRYVVQPADAGSTLSCIVKATSDGGLAIARSQATGPVTAPAATTASARPIEPSSPPAQPPASQPQQDDAAPVARVATATCGATTCVLRGTVTHAGFWSGVRSIRATHRSTCTRRVKKASCTQSRTKTAAVRLLSGNRFKVFASRLAAGMQLFTVAAVDKAGHRQALPTRRTVRTRGSQ